MSIDHTNATQAKQRVTLRLPSSLIQASHDAVRLGLAKSSNAFMEDAIRLKAKEVRYAKLEQLAKEAMADPDFVADMREVSASFGLPLKV